jgi:hypothetical protein
MCVSAHMVIYCLPNNSLLRHLERVDPRTPSFCRLMFVIVSIAGTVIKLPLLI